VCIVAPVYPDIGGLRSVVWQLIRALNEKYEAFVLSVKWMEEEKPRYVHYDIAFNLKLKLLFSPWHFPTMVLYLISGAIWCFALRMLGVKRFLVQEAIVSAFLVTLVGKTIGADVYVFDYAPMLNLYNPRFVKKAGKYERGLLRVFYAKLFKIMNEFSLRHCDKFFVYGEEIGRCARKHGLADEKIAYYSFPVDSTVFRAYETGTKQKIREKFGFKSNEIIVTYVGRISEDKGLPYLFESAKALLEKYDGRLRFVLAGDGPLVEWLVDSVSRYKEQVSFLGPLYDPLKVAELLNASDIFVHPITVSYGYALSVLEAMAIGLPSIMTDVGPTKELIANYENGIIIPANDVNALSEALDRLIRDGNLRKHVGENAKDILTRFSVETYKETILNNIE